MKKNKKLNFYSTWIIVNIFNNSVLERKREKQESFRVFALKKSIFTLSSVGKQLNPNHSNIIKPN